MSTLKKVVISSNNTTRALAFFAEVRAKKEAAFKKIEARTKEVTDSIKKQAIASR